MLVLPPLLLVSLSGQSSLRTLVRSTLLDSVALCASGLEETSSLLCVSVREAHCVCVRWFVVVVVS